MGWVLPRLGLTYKQMVLIRVFDIHLHIISAGNKCLDADVVSWCLGWRNLLGDWKAHKNHLKSDHFSFWLSENSSQKESSIWNLNSKPNPFESILFECVLQQSNLHQIGPKKRKMNPKDVTILIRFQYQREASSNFCDVFCYKKNKKRARTRQTARYFVLSSTQTSSWYDWMDSWVVTSKCINYNSILTIFILY